MTRSPPALRTGLAAACVLASCLWLAGCAGPFGFSGAEGKAHPFRTPGMSMQTAMETVAIDKFSKEDVMAALGPGTVVRFDSGFEVWVYRSTPSGGMAAKAEFVILFDPSGIVKKTRIRPAYAVARSIRTECGQSSPGASSYQFYCV